MNIRGIIPFWPSMLAKLTGYQDMSSPELTVAIRGAQKLCQRLSSKISSKESSESIDQFTYGSSPLSAVVSTAPTALSLPSVAAAAAGAQTFPSPDIQAQVRENSFFLL